MSIVLHPTTKLELEQFTVRPAHALLIVGPEGSGKSTISRRLAAALLQVDNPENYPHYRTIEPDGHTISIETIRELLNFTKLKIAGEGIRRIIIIEQAQTMTTEAQNAMLKLLEEPPEGTVFLLDVANAQDLLPTVRSRTQQLSVRQPSAQALEQHFATQGFDSQRIKNAMLMSGGLPGLMHALLLGSEEHPLVQAVEQARAILKASTFERLAMVDLLAKQKSELTRVLFVLQQMAHAALRQGNTNSLKRWSQILKVAYDASEALANNAQTKLVLTNLMLGL